jgi:hypothetical protein
MHPMQSLFPSRAIVPGVLPPIRFTLVYSFTGTIKKSIIWFVQRALQLFSSEISENNLSQLACWMFHLFTSDILGHLMRPNFKGLRSRLFALTYLVHSTNIIRGSPSPSPYRFRSDEQATDTLSPPSNTSHGYRLLLMLLLCFGTS